MAVLWQGQGVGKWGGYRQCEWLYYGKGRVWVNGEDSGSVNGCTRARAEWR